MRPLLDDLELVQVQEIGTYDKRALAEHKPPGMAGSLLQNLGRRPARIVLWGIATGPDALQFTQNLDDKFRAGQPLPFIADIVAESKIEKVVIDDLRFQDLAGKPERYAYVLTLREFIEPKEPQEAAPLDGSILDEAQSLVNQITGGLDAGLNLPTGLERFVAPLGELLARLQQTNKDLNR
jgi:hypothetical protein